MSQQMCAFELFTEHYQKWPIMIGSPASVKSDRLIGFLFMFIESFKVNLNGLQLVYLT